MDTYRSHALAVPTHRYKPHYAVELVIKRHCTSSLMAASEIRQIIANKTQQDSCCLLNIIRGHHTKLHVSYGSLGIVFVYKRSIYSTISSAGWEWYLSSSASSSF